MPHHFLTNLFLNICSVSVGKKTAHSNARQAFIALCQELGCKAGADYKWIPFWILDKDPFVLRSQKVQGKRVLENCITFFLYTEVPFMLLKDRSSFDNFWALKFLVHLEQGCFIRRAPLVRLQTSLEDQH